MNMRRLAYGSGWSAAICPMPLSFRYATSGIAKTLSHATVCCDARDITSCERGTGLAYDGASHSVKAAAVYPGID